MKYCTQLYAEGSPAAKTLETEVATPMNLSGEIEYRHGKVHYVGVIMVAKSRCEYVLRWMMDSPYDH